MKLRQNWLFLVVFLVFISLFLAACERPLPGGYNDSSTPPDTTAPGAPMDVPEVDPEGAYPAQEEPAAPEDVEPADAAQPAEGYPAEEGEADQGLTAEEQPAAEEPAPDTEQTEPVDTVEEQAVEETTDQAEPSDEAATPAGEGEVEAAEQTPGTHTVAAGENLYRIGLLYGINWVDLAQANGITDPASLYVGQVLVLPGS